MSADPGLDQLSREELVQRARELGARRPEVMTRIELRDEIVRLSEPDPLARRRSRGWLGVARDLVASVMDAGLNLPVAAAAIRGDARPAEETTGPPPVATLTLAEIYLAQGHVERALAVLEEVLIAEPELEPALALRDRIRRGELQTGRRRPPAVIEEEEEEPIAIPSPAPFITPPPPAVSRPAPQPEPQPQPNFPPAPAPDSLSVSAPAPQHLAANTRHDESPPPAPDHPAPAPVPAPAFPSAPGPEPLAVTVRHDEVAPPAPAPVPPAVILPDQEPFVASVASPDAVRVPLMYPPEPAPPTLAAPSRDAPSPVLASPAAPDTIESSSVAPACALAQSPTAVEGHYALPPRVTGAFLRVAWFVPGRDGPTQGGVDVPLSSPRGRVTLPIVESSAHVRAVLGVGAGGSFRPLAVAWVYRVAEGQVSTEFAPPGDEPLVLRAQLGRAAADLAV